MSTPSTVYAEHSGALVLVGAFLREAVEVDDYTARLQRLIETATDSPAPAPAEIHDAALAALACTTEAAVTMEEYTRLTRPKQADPTPHPASKRQCIQSINQLPS